MIFFVVVCSCMAQTSVADSLRNEGQLDNAISEYKKVFAEDPENRDNTYNLACALALTYHQNGSAFHYLDISLRTDSSLWALADPRLNWNDRGRTMEWNGISADVKVSIKEWQVVPIPSMRKNCFNL